MTTSFKYIIKISQISTGIFKVQNPSLFKKSIRFRTFLSPWITSRSIAIPKKCVYLKYIFHFSSYTFPKGKWEKCIKLCEQGRWFSCLVCALHGQGLPGEHTLPGELNSHCTVSSSIVSQEQSCLSLSALAVQQHLICERMDHGIMNYLFYFFSGPSTLFFWMRFRIYFPYNCYLTYTNAGL